ncbi:MAG: hypothetical protein HZA77_09450 [Candidatus Schekmanbacteria bacterium]|nr:hypothetical protein [Candidatus Schekmanbacteria bacterium]
MSEEYSFPPYMEVMEDAVKVFGGTRMESYNGKDIKPLWDLNGEGFKSYKYLYKAPKLQKIVVGFQSFKEMLMSYAMMIWPDDEHDLPVFSSYWAENKKGSFFIIDLYPTADCIVDIPYMEKNLDPLEDAYDKGTRTYFPGLSGMSTNWFRALSSPYCITGNIAPSTKDSQNKIMELTMDYFKIFVDLWKKAEPKDKNYMKRLIERREAIRINFREKDPGGIMVVKAVGEEMAELSLEALF